MEIHVARGWGNSNKESGWKGSGWGRVWERVVEGKWRKVGGEG